MARGAYFNPNVDPRLLKALEANEKFGGYSTRMTSGYRPGDKRQHGRNAAVDLELIDAEGKALDNYQSPETFRQYQQYANQVYQWAQANDPGLAKELRWGGYFSGGKDKYGALDLMHFDTAGDQIGMAGGSWQGGLNPDQAKLWGLQAGGGAGGASGGGAAPDTPEGKFIAQMWPYALAQSQRTGVDARIILSQAALESGYGKSAPGGNYFGIKGSQANMGAPQKTLEFVNGKMTPTTANFRQYDSPEASFEDYGSFLLNNKRYAGMLQAKGLEAQVAELGKSGYATDPEYASKILKIAQGIPEGGYGASTASDPAVAGDFPPPPSTKKEKTPWQKFGAGFAKGLGTAEAPKVVASGVGEQPRAVLAANEPTTFGDAGGQQAEMKRQSLAAIMARLNSGKLF